MTPRRDWTSAEFKRTACRVCGETYGVELAHITRRFFDQPKPGSKVLLVKADSVVPLCGPATDSTSCHGRFDSGRLDLLPYLLRSEEVQAVADLGLETARMRLCPSAYESKRVPRREVAA